MIEAYPLSWPLGWPRTSLRSNGKFRSGNNWVTTADAVSRVMAELRRFGVTRPSIIVSTNIETKSDGLPRSDRNVVLPDPGAAVYWTDPETKQQQCIAIDQYTWVSDNLAAIAATLDAMRAIERHGGAQILKRAFEGFKALPAAGGTIVTLSATQAVHVIARLSGYGADEINMPLVLRDPCHCKRWLRSAKARTHPDAGGRNEDWTLLQEAERVLTAHHGGKL